MKITTNFTLDVRLVASLERIAKKQGIPRSKLVNKLLTDYIGWLDLEEKVKKERR